jgi:hypothetical protein
LLTTSIGTKIRRQKQIRISIEKAMDLGGYVIPIILPLILMFVICMVCVIIIYCKTYGLELVEEIRGTIFLAEQNYRNFFLKQNILLAKPNKESRGRGVGVKLEFC